MRGAVPPLFQMPSWGDAWSNKRITVVVSVNGRFCEIRHWYAVALTATEGVCTIRPADRFRVFKGCAKCGLRIDSVCLRDVQNAACGYVRCVSFTTRCPAPSVLHTTDRSERSITFLIDVYFYGRSKEHNFVVCLMQRYRPGAWFPCHPSACVSIT
jgi:hypothetical protein